MEAETKKEYLASWNSAIDNFSILGWKCKTPEEHDELKATQEKLRAIVKRSADRCKW